MLRKPRPLPQRFNRPITPLTRSIVHKRHARKKQHASYRFQRLVQRIHRRSAAIRTTVIRFLSLIVGGGVVLIIGLALFSPIMELRAMTVVRTDPRVDSEQIQMTLAPLFGEHLFFLSSQQVVDLLEASLPDLASVDIQKQYPSTLEIRVELQPIIAKLVIDDLAPVVTSATGAVTGTGALPVIRTADFLTDKGVYVTYPPANAKSQTGTMLLHITDWGVRPEHGTQLMEPEILTMMRGVTSELEREFNHKVSLRRVYIRAREFHVQTEKYSLWFDTRSSLEEQIRRYRLFLQSAGSNAATKYVDLRLKDKIVYY